MNKICIKYYRILDSFCNNLNLAGEPSCIKKSLNTETIAMHCTVVEWVEINQIFLQDVLVTECSLGLKLS